ncbi:hypothetical protein BH23CHL5_BH23CHL5_04760 [soil metagenome]
MAVVAHPDDESLAFGGTLVKYAAEGADISVVMAARGNGTAIMASEEAGPMDRRYMATVLASIGCVALVVGAGSLGMLLGLFPAGLIPALAGLAVLTSLAEGTRKSMSAEFPMSGFVAMLIAASSVAAFGLGSVF